MTPKARVLAALAHREPDRIPWGEHSIDYNVYEDILGRPTLCQAKFRETKAMWEGRRDEVVASYKRDRVDLIKALEMDIVFVSAVAPKDYRPEPMEKLDKETYHDKEGNLYRISATTHDLMPYRRKTTAYNAPTMESVERQIAAVEAAPPGDPNDSKWELVHHVVKELGKTHFVLLLCGDLTYPNFGANEEECWANLLLEPELCKKIGELTGKQLLRDLEVQSRLGVDGIMPCGDLGHSTGMLASPKVWREMAYPWNKAQCDLAHKLGLKVFKHCCGQVWPVVHDLAGIYDAHEGIQASGGMDIKKYKELVGGKMTLWGGIWHEHIILGSVEDIRDDARYAFQHAAPGGGYIMGSTHSLAVDARRENILEMKRCRDEWGVYPINPKNFE